MAQNTQMIWPQQFAIDRSSLIEVLKKPSHHLCIDSQGFLMTSQTPRVIHAPGRVSTRHVLPGSSQADRRVPVNSCHVCSAPVDLEAIEQLVNTLCFSKYHLDITYSHAQFIKV